MENEQNKNFIQSNEELSDIFKIDYGTQNLEKNILPYILNKSSIYIKNGVN